MVSPRKLQEIAGVTDCLIFVYGLQRKNDPHSTIALGMQNRLEGGTNPVPHIALTSI